LLEIEADAAAVHPARITGSQLHLEPLRAFLLRFELERLVVFNRRHDRRVQARTRAHVHVTVRIVDHATIVRERSHRQTKANGESDFHGSTEWSLGAENVRGKSESA